MYYFRILFFTKKKKEITGLQERRRPSKQPKQARHYQK